MRDLHQKVSGEGCNTADEVTFEEHQKAINNQASQGSVVQMVAATGDDAINLNNCNSAEP